MNELSPVDEQLVESLKKMPQTAPDEIKSELLYQCGLSAGRSEHRRHKVKRQFATLAGLLAAFFAGALINLNSVNSTPEDLIARQQPIDKQPLVVIRQPRIWPAADRSVLSAAMSPVEVRMLLSKKSDKSEADDVIPSAVPNASFGVLSHAELLN